MQKALESRGFISAILAMAIGMFLFYTHPFPKEQIFLRVIAMRAPQAFLSFKYLYYTLLFTTPYLACSLPFAEQILAYKAADRDKRIGGLVLEVKGDFCRKVKDILGRHQRAEDYIEISLDSEYCYNPLHNDLDAYALAYNIASLLNNLFGRGKEPFWQQAYTNLVKFIILLHKAAYDFVTFFDVYQCAISPPLLEERIAEAEDIILAASRMAFLQWPFAIF